MANSIKLLFTMLLGFMITNTCYPNEFWPSSISCYFISEYVKQKHDLHIDDLQTEYDYVLNFLEKAILAYRTNIASYYNEDRLIRFIPALENGKLVINEVDNTVRVVTEHGIREKINTLILVEYFHFTICLLTYNDLIDFWYDKTGILLRDKYSLIEEKELWSFIMSKDDNIKTGTWTPEEFDAMIKELGIDWVLE